MGAQSIVTEGSNTALGAVVGDTDSALASALFFGAGSGPSGKPSFVPVSAEQAVFTSIRSATAGGYRIIAASPGLTPPERQEITQRCPSHASLTDNRETAEALLAWPLRSGRHAVAWSRHAGFEHTGRGGYRVHTHVAVLDGQAYRKFQCHAVRVYTAMLEALPVEPFLEATPSLETLLLPDPAANYHVWISAIGIGCSRESIFGLLGAVLAGKTAAAMGVVAPFTVVDAVLAMLPQSQRAEISLSIGLKPSPSRPSRVLLLDGDAEEARRLTGGQNVCWLNLPGATAGASESEAGWLGLARRWWADGRRGHLCRLAERVTFRASRGDLDRIAGICQDVDAVQGAGAETLEQLAARYATFHPANALEAELVAAARQAFTGWQAG